MDCEGLNEGQVLEEDLEGQGLAVVHKLGLQVVVHHHLQGQWCMHYNYKKHSNLLQKEAQFNILVELLLYPEYLNNTVSVIKFENF